MSKISFTLFILFFCLPIIIFAQYEEQEEWPEMTALSIPSAPAFSLLGVNPEMITRPADVKEFKVDWRIKNYKVAPDLALEAQPLWWLYFKKQGPEALMKATKIEQILSTTSFSLATAKIDNVNHMSYALKFNLYKEHDPLFDAARLKESNADFKEDIKPLNNELDSLQRLYIKATHKDSIRDLRLQISDKKYEIKTLTALATDAIKEEAHAINQENWNMSMVDAGFGRVYTYDNTAIDSLNFRKAGWGLWVNASRGIKKNGLLTGMVRLNHVGINNDFLLGASYRYGSERYNFFAELIYNKMNNIPQNGFLDEEQFQSLRSEDLGVGWYGFEDGESIKKWTLTYGGDFRLNNRILLNFALRTNLTSDLKFQSFLPIANVVCLMN